MAYHSKEKLMKYIYLDYSSTTPCHPEVVKAMQPYFTEIYGNPSSLYSCGHEAKEGTEKARASVAKLIGAREDEIVFTSGGTESDNHALKGTALASDPGKNHIITNGAEHHAIIVTCRSLERRGFKITRVPVDSYGMVDPDEVKNTITPQTILVSIMHANNEVGTIQPIAEISKITREAGVPFHTDAVQSVGHIPVDVNEMGVDMLSISSHKLYGPKGVGVLYIRKGVKPFSLIHGGEQEFGRRAGTYNVPGIVGLGKAAEIAMREMDEEVKRLVYLRDKLIKGLTGSIKDSHLNGHPEKRLPGNSNITIDFVEGEAMCLHLDLQGICASTGSACASSSLEPSHVLMSMGFPPERAHGAIRMTLGKWTTEEEIDKVLDILPGIITKLRAMSPLHGA